MADVRILLVGDKAVGKTSLVLALVSEEFPNIVPPKAEEITIPADITPERVPTQIVDFSMSEQTEDQLVSEIRQANVVCVVYSLIDPGSVDSVSSHWLPLLRKHRQADKPVPVVLVGNKSDASERSQLPTVLKVMNSYPEVETCIECSAKLLHNLSETFWFAQKAVLYPTFQLYRPDDKELTVQCRTALTRIFRICDLDNDGYMNDRELELFQRRCFRVPLNPQSLEEVKQAVKRRSPEGVLAQGLTLKGFLQLHQMFVQKGRHETTWAVLRRFGYDNDLRLCVRGRRLCGCRRAAQLSSAIRLGIFCLLCSIGTTAIGTAACRPTELQSLFACCPMTPAHAPNCTETNALGWITRSGFLSQWVLLTYLEPSRALELLVCLGYTYEFENPLSAVQVTRERRLDLDKRQTSRTVFLVKVMGAKKVGKTCFLQGLLGRNLQYICTLNRTQTPVSFTCAPVSVYGQERHLILEEVDHSRAEQLSPAELHECDAAALLYDITDPDSFKFIAHLYLNLLRPNKIPAVLVGTKSDQHETPQYYPLSADEFCAKYRLGIKPLKFTLSGSGVHGCLREGGRGGQLSPPERLAAQSQRLHLEAGPGSYSARWLSVLWPSDTSSLAELS
uniref:Mitochondrial Rho GTPase n=1 Tax=Macrostomum lignano TaxID=282301 RepID=A0A1I8JAZ4_9PLAT